MQNIRLNVLGLSYSQAQTGAYALILADEADEKRIPIVIGAAEAQSIAITLEKMTTPRPLTHDLFKSFSDGFGIDVIEVNIYRLEAGIFYAEIVCERKKTSPIYTTTEIMNKAGISMSEKEDFTKEERKERKPRIIKEETQETPHKSESVFSGYTISQLKALMDEAIKNEDYERASQIRDEINEREA